MAGNIKVKNEQISKDISVPFQIASYHQCADKPGFGGELEVMLLQHDGDSLKPIPYESADGPCTKSIFETFLRDYEYTTGKVIDGNPVVLSGKDRSILCMEKYATVIERTDTAFPANTEGLRALIDSVNLFAERMDIIAKDHNLVISPYDFDPYCNADIYDETMEAPSERFGDDGYLAQHDQSHPKVDMIDRRTSSCHFSVGYRDHKHLKNMMKALTVLTPALYAAYSTVKPTYAAEIDGHTKLLNHEDAMAFDGELTAVPVPRALAWTLAVPERSGLPEKIIETVFDESSSVEDVIAAYCDYNEIINTPPDNPESFLNIAQSGAIDMKQYAKHIGTLWLDWRVDPIRLEARMAGTGTWKLNSMACLMFGAFMNEDGLAKTLKAIEKAGITPSDVAQARQNVAFKGMKTAMGDSHSCQSLLKEIAVIAQSNLPAEFHDDLSSLLHVLESGRSDAEILLQSANNPIDLAKIPLAQRKPLAAYKGSGNILSFTTQPD